MDIKTLLDMFQQANIRNQWGAYSKLVFYDDGTGEIVDDEDDNILSFDSISELEEELKRAMKA